MYGITLSRLLVEYRNLRLMLDNTIKVYDNWDYSKDGSSTKHLPQIISRYAGKLQAIEDSYDDYSIAYNLSYLFPESKSAEDSESDTQVNLVRLMQLVTKLKDDDMTTIILLGSNQIIPISEDLMKSLWHAKLLADMINSADWDDSHQFLIIA